MKGHTIIGLSGAEYRIVRTDPGHIRLERVQGEAPPFYWGETAGLAMHVVDADCMCDWLEMAGPDDLVSEFPSLTSGDVQANSDGVEYSLVEQVGAFEAPPHLSLALSALRRAMPGGQWIYGLILHRGDESLIIPIGDRAAILDALQSRGAQWQQEWDAAERGTQEG